jgi:hypothetical protein
MCGKTFAAASATLAPRDTSRMSSSVTPLSSAIDQAVSAQPGIVAYRLPADIREGSSAPGSIHQFMLTTVFDR